MASLPNLTPASSGAELTMVHVVKTNGNQPAHRATFRASAQGFGGWARALAAPGRRAGSGLAPGFAYWRGLGSRHVTALCTRPDVEGRRVAVPSPSEEDLAVLASAAPMIPGAEYLTVEMLGALWEAIGEAFTAEQAECGATVQEFLKRLNPAWNVVGKVHFHVADNRVTHALPGAWGALRQLPRWARTSTR